MPWPAPPSSAAASSASIASLLPSASSSLSPTFSPAVREDDDRRVEPAAAGRDLHRSTLRNAMADDASRSHPLPYALHAAGFFPTATVPRSRSSVQSVQSVQSAASTASTSTTSTQRRFWSPTSSPSSSPPSPLSTSPTLVSDASVAASSVTSRRVSATTATTTTTTTTTATATAPPPPYARLQAIHRVVPAVTSGHVVTYIPPLVDGAGGTVSRWQRASRHSVQRRSTAPLSRQHGQLDHPSPASSASSASSASAYGLLAADLRWLTHAAPELARLVWARATRPLLAVLAPRVWARPLALPVDAVADAAEAALQIGLAVAVVATLAVAPVLFLLLPGAVALAWLAVCVAGLRLAAWPLNWAVGDLGDGPRDDHPADDSADGSADYFAGYPVDDTVDDTVDTADDRWFFVSGLGATSRSLAKTVPRVAGVFGRPVTLVRPAYTYGAVADLLLALLHRLVLPWRVLPAPGADALYAALRRALVTSRPDALGRPRQRRVVVLAHNAGATTVSHALARLLGDVSASRLAQLEIYTFGALAPDFVLPSPPPPPPSEQKLSDVSSHDTPHVEHVAHARDPCARFGVLRSVTEDLTGRYCGSVFVLSAGAVGGVGGSGSGSSLGSSLGSGGRANASRTSASPRGRCLSPPLDPAVGSTSGTNPQHRLSFPMTRRQQHHQKPLFRRSASVTSIMSVDSSRSSSRGGGSGSSRRHGHLFVAPPPSPLLSMEDYLIALFGPEPWSMRPPDMNSDGLLAPDAFFLDAAMCADRELAERREMAAMAQAGAGASMGDDGAAFRGRTTATSRTAHRLSWTGLGATAKFGSARGGGGGNGGAFAGAQKPTDVEGLRGLETARRLCKEHDGRPGREVSRLAGYFSSAVVRHRERFGF